MDYLLWIPYRIVRLFATANVCRFFELKLLELPRTPSPKGYEVLSVSSDSIRAHASSVDYQISDRDLALLDSGDAKCFVAFQNERIAGFAWVAFGNIPCDMNHDGKPETGLPIQLADDSAFVFQVLVIPAHRGRRLYAAILGRMADDLTTAGVRKFVLTTEGSNWRARRAVERMRFRKVGQATLFCLGPIRHATYPALPQDAGFTIGRYSGDKTSPS